jgi:hypothetical protein
VGLVPDWLKTEGIQKFEENLSQNIKNDEERAQEIKDRIKTRASDYVDDHIISDSSSEASTEKRVSLSPPTSAKVETEDSLRKIYESRGITDKKTQDFLIKKRLEKQEKMGLERSSISPYVPRDSMNLNGILNNSNLNMQSGSYGGDSLGNLSARYESGSRGSGAVGWDSTGGTSYGKYQIATKTGTMNEFMKYLKTNNPEAYSRLSAAGPADSGKNGKFAQEWQALAKEGMLGNSEHDFIKKTHYDVGMSGIGNKSLQEMIGNNKALQEMMWSTSVQHGGGGASSIFNKSFKEGMSEEDFIKAVYAKRGTQFGNSSSSVQKAVKNRFADEEQKALAMLDIPNNRVGSTMLASNNTNPIMLASNVDPTNVAKNLQTVSSYNAAIQPQVQPTVINNVNNSKNVQNNSTQSSVGSNESHGTSSRTESFMRSLMA